MKRTDRDRKNAIQGKKKETGEAFSLDTFVIVVYAKKCQLT